MERFGQIDVLVNNAALFAPLKETKSTCRMCLTASLLRNCVLRSCRRRFA